MQFSDDNKKLNDLPEKQLRLPLLLRVGLVAFLLAALVIGMGGTFFWRYHKRMLVEEKIRSAAHILDVLEATAKTPLLTDDALRLASLTRAVSEIEEIIYAAVLDRDQNIRAQAGQGNLLGQKSLLEIGEILSHKNATMVVKYTEPEAGRVYDLSKDIVYNGKPLGTVNLRLSERDILESLNATLSTFLKGFWGLAFSILLMFCFVAMLYTLRVQRRNDRLLWAVEEYGDGNLHYRIEHIENNESGDLARALHNMAQKLLLQEPSQAKLEQYLKFSSLDRILENPMTQDDPYAFRRQVAVVFASIKGFGSFAGTEQPENIIKSLNKYISIVTKIISKHGGYVDKVVGDAVVGIFGVSLYHRDHTARAIQAALDLQEALSVGNQTESQLLSNVCVGISSGIVLSGNIGSFSKVEYSSIGESIKEAYWLSNLGHPGEIILGEEIYGQMQDGVQVEPLPPQNVLGVSDAMICYRLLGFTEKAK